MKYAFDGIEHKKDMINDRNRLFKNEAQNRMSILETKLRHKNLSRWFNRFKLNGASKAQKEQNLRNVIAGKITKFYRDTFEKWKKNADMLEVIRFNNEEGPVAIELHEVNMNIKNLKFMIEDKMIMNKEELKDCI